MNKGKKFEEILEEFQIKDEQEEIDDIDGEDNRLFSDFDKILLKEMGRYLLKKAIVVLVIVIFTFGGIKTYQNMSADRMQKAEIFAESEYVSVNFSELLLEDFLDVLCSIKEWDTIPLEKKLNVLQFIAKDQFSLFEELPNDVLVVCAYAFEDVQYNQVKGKIEISRAFLETCAADEAIKYICQEAFLISQDKTGKERNVLEAKDYARKEYFLYVYWVENYLNMDKYSKSILAEKEVSYE